MWLFFCSELMLAASLLHFSSAMCIGSGWAAQWALSGGTPAVLTGARFGPDCRFHRKMSLLPPPYPPHAPRPDPRYPHTAGKQVPVPGLCQPRPASARRGRAARTQSVCPPAALILRRKGPRRRCPTLPGPIAPSPPVEAAPPPRLGVCVGGFPPATTPPPGGAAAPGPGCALPALPLPGRAASQPAWRRRAAVTSVRRAAEPAGKCSLGGRSQGRRWGCGGRSGPWGRGAGAAVGAEGSLPLGGGGQRARRLALGLPSHGGWSREVPARAAPRLHPRSRRSRCGRFCQGKFKEVEGNQQRCFLYCWCFTACDCGWLRGLSHTIILHPLPLRCPRVGCSVPGAASPSEDLASQTASEQPVGSQSKKDYF